MTTLNAPWLAIAEIQKLTAAFAAAGQELRFVGGAVRDTILDRDFSEIDAATPATPEQVTALLEAAGLRAIPTGIDHGTVIALVDGLSFEITTLRKDVSTDGRHADVAFTTRWEDDAKRRDFTMNALYLGTDGTLYDYTNGVEDCHARRVRFIGDANARVQEDYLRILRYFRFVAQLGKNQWDAASINACRAHSAGIAKLSGERIAQELFKLLAADDAVIALERMQENGVLQRILPFDISHQDRLPRGAAALLRLALLIRQPFNVAAATMRLKLSSRQSQTLELWLGNVGHITPDMPQNARHKLIRKIGGGNYLSIVKLAAALTGNDFSAFEKDANWAAPTFPVTAQDLMERGYTQGKALGDKLRELENIWEENGYKQSREELLTLL